MYFCCGQGKVNCRAIQRGYVSEALIAFEDESSFFFNVKKELASLSCAIPIEYGTE